jgi:hypothetical protein
VWLADLDLKYYSHMLNCDVTKLENARILYQNSDKTAAEVCRTAGVGRRVFFAYLAQKHD